jgi:hypothetical protein
MFVFMTLHYPSADNVQALAQGMAQMRGWMESQPGCLGVEPPLLSEMAPAGRLLSLGIQGSVPRYRHRP